MDYFSFFFGCFFVLFCLLVISFLKLIVFLIVKMFFKREEGSCVYVFYNWERIMDMGE